MIKLSRKLNKTQKLKNNGRKFMFNKNLKEIPIFFSTDDNYVPCLVVAIRSLIDTSSKENMYILHILNTGLNEESKQVLTSMETDNVKIKYVDVSAKIDDIYHKLKAQLRDYYSPAIYYRLFIPSLFPQYKKALYLDCDITIIRDIADLYNVNLGNNLIGGCIDEVVANSEIFSNYMANGVGVIQQKYFNSGIIVMNLEGFRKENLEDKFLYLLNNYPFSAVCPDQDYLNILCKDKVHYLAQGWDKMPIADPTFDEKDLYLVHYNMFDKPWKYEGVLYEKYFWDAAKKTPYYNMLLQMQKDYGDERRAKDRQALQNLLNYANQVANDPNNFKRTLDREREALAQKQEIELKSAEEFNILDDFLNLFFDEEPIASGC